MRLCRAYYRGRDGRKRQSKRWYCELTDHRDTVRRVPAFEDKRASDEFGRKLETLVSIRVSGDRPNVAMTLLVLAAGTLVVTRRRIEQRDSCQRAG